jgi:hypothetical protein
VARHQAPLLAWSDSSGDALGDFLQHPQVAVRVGEGGLADVRAAVGIAAGFGGLPRERVRDLAHVDTAVDEFRAGRLDVVDDEQEALLGIGRLGSDQRFRRSEVEPPVGIEPTTFSLRVRRSAD